MITYLQKLKAKKGFTLVELIVVVAIIAVLTAILVPTIMNYTSDAAKSAANANAKTILDSTKIVVSSLDTEGKGIIPAAGKKYITGSKIDAEVNVVPAADSNGVSFAGTGSEDFIKDLKVALNGLPSGSYFIIEVNNGVISGAIWSETNIGTFPTEVKDGYATVSSAQVLVGVSPDGYIPATTAAAPPA